MIKKFDYDQIQKSIKDFQRFKLTESKILIAVSGGLDSVVLLDHLLEIQRYLPSLVIGVLHYHHGITGQRATDAFRNKAQEFVRVLVEKQDVLFVTNTPNKNKLRSEEQLRDKRLHFYDQNLMAAGFDRIATAHHADDQFETQVMRLIRGSGPQGLKAMDYVTPQKIRPLLGWSRSEILVYAKKKKLKWIEDPSNKNKIHFRNWMRNKWFKDLEKMRPGSLKTFRESLRILSQSLEETKGFESSDWITDFGVKREAFVFLNKAEKRSLLAFYFKNLNLRNYKITHIDEVLKRLDSPQKVITFELLKCRWTIDTQHISAERVL